MRSEIKFSGSLRPFDGVTAFFFAGERNGRPPRSGRTDPSRAAPALIRRSIATDDRAVPGMTPDEPGASARRRAGPAISGLASPRRMPGIRLETRIIRELVVKESAKVAGLARLSAASRLMTLGDRLYVVAHDQRCLAIFDLSNRKPSRLFSIFDGELPLRHKARQAAKPDCETVLVLPAFGCFESEIDARYGQRVADRPA